jgi:1-acyl-sn-glycerol-3-phosphate acyltransferase
MAFLRSALFVVIFYLGSIVMVLAAIAAVPFGQAAIIAASRRWALWHRWCAGALLGIRAQVVGSLPQSDALVVFKHEAMFETIEVLTLFDAPAVVMKQELIDIFGWGYVALRHGVIPVDRDAGASALRHMLIAAKAAKAQHRPVILFPEGTRVTHGETPPLRAGFAGLYKILALPVVPVALDSGKLWPRGFLRRPGTVTMLVGETIPPGLPREEVEARVHAAINALNRV